MPPPPKQRRASKAELAVRRAAACRLAASGWTYEKIHREAGLGYNSRQAVFADVQAAYKQRIAEQHLAVDELRQRELDLIDEALIVAREIMHEQHIAVSNGRVVRREVEQPDGSCEYVEVIDRAPNLAAAAALVKFGAERRKLQGIDVPAKVGVDVSGTVGYVINVSSEELEQL